MKPMIIFDLETTLDIDAVCRGLRVDPNNPELAREMAGDFAKLPFHRIIAIGRMEVTFLDGAWSVHALECDHAGPWSESEMLRRFDSRINHSGANLVGFGISAFDLVVLRYRAMMAATSMPALTSRKFFARYLDDAEDLCDHLASYDARNKVSLDLLSRVLGYGGKPDDIDGSKLEPLIEKGRFDKIASYCIQDVLMTYVIWLRHRLFSGLSATAYNESHRRLQVFLRQNLPEFVEVVTPNA